MRKSNTNLQYLALAFGLWALGYALYLAYVGQ